MTLDGICKRQNFHSLPRMMAVVLVGLMVASVTSINARAGTATPVPSVSIIVRGGSSRFTSDCGPADAARLVTDFLAAFNRGDHETLASFFPATVAYPDTTKRGFQWFSVTDSHGNFVTYNPDDLPAYFAARHAQHERLQLRQLEISAGPPSAGFVRLDLAFNLDRQADDLPDSRSTGKGAIDCAGMDIFVWSLASAPDEAPRASPIATPLTVK